MIDRRSQPLMVMPNPFYQIYEGAALLAGAEPYFLNNTAAHGFVPDYDAVPPLCGSAASCCICARRIIPPAR